MIHWLSRVYRRIGIHAAPPGTLFFLIHSLGRRILYRRIFGFVTGNAYTRARFGGIPYYDIRHARKTRSIEGFALVYFMGAGDYLMTTPLISALHLAHPDLPIYAYGSSHTDTVNSPLVIQLLRVNPLIERVFSYSGRPRSVWMDYDFSDAMKDIPKNFLVLPVFYDVEPLVFHRATAVLETFGLPADLPVPAPIAYSTMMSATAQTVLRAILTRIETTEATGIVCTHFGARSSGYEYPHAEDLIERLIKLGMLVVSFSPVDLRDDKLIQVDITKVSVTDSIEILRALSTAPAPLFMISVNSIMWPVSAALGIPNLGMHTFWDPAIHQYLYPNIFPITQHFYTQLSPSRWFCPPDLAYQTRLVNDRVWFTDYNPPYVIDCFQTMQSLSKT
jgi:hypothetical protein